jgi:hypothetical protein
VLRLIGLPHVVRFPKVMVTRFDDRFELLFHGAEHSTCLQIDFRYLEDAGDVEATEFRLLARLQELGYEVERGSPVPPEGGAGT